MPLLSSRELESLRADLEDLLPDTCHILSRTGVTDANGTYTETWGTATANVACRIDPYRGREAMGGEQVMPFHTYVCTMPYGTTVTTANRIKAGTVEYNITSVSSGRSWPLDVRAWLEVI